MVNEEPHSVVKPSETAKGRIPSNQRGDVSWKSSSDQWKENHGTLLMSFAALVLLAGIAVLAYQQNRFRAPAFPSGDSINQVPQAATEPDASGQPGITLRVLGVSNAGGSVRVAVYHSSENFNDSDKADWKSFVPSGNSDFTECFVPLEALAETVAIAVYQDANDNGQLDRGLLGIPSERYGFSNAARGKVGPPSFDQASIAKPEPDSQIELEIW